MGNSNCCCGPILRPSWRTPSSSSSRANTVSANWRDAARRVASPLPPSVPDGGHGGSHGHLAHEFVTAILTDREPLVNICEALAMTVPRIIAHQSALKDGERLKMPQKERPKA
jgi:hypothetical protein